MQNIKLRFNLPNHTQHHNFSLYNNLLHNMMLKNISNTVGLPYSRKGDGWEYNTRAVSSGSQVPIGLGS